MARLALAGGTPVRSAPFPRWPDFDARERTLLLEALEARSWGGYPFPNAMAERFGAAFAAAHDAKHAFAVANGTIAIEIALVAAGLRPGDEVIVPAYTFEASAAPVLRLGGVPVFVDVLPDTYCIDPAEAAPKPLTAALTAAPYAVAVGEGAVWIAANTAGVSAAGRLIALDPATGARRASVASWMRPSALRCAALKLWMPIDSRLIPAARNCRNFSASKVPGFASRVISASLAKGRRARTADRIASMPCGENRLGVPPPKNTLQTLRPQTSGSACSRSAVSAAM